MLNINFSSSLDDKNEIVDTSMYFKNQYEGKWLTNEFGKKVIKDIDKSDVISEKIISSPFLGEISPNDLSGGVKTVLLIKNVKNKVFNASNCGDNCAKWILEIAKNRKVLINLHHIMDFGESDFKIKVVNTGKIVHNMNELILEAGTFV